MNTSIVCLFPMKLCEAAPRTLVNLCVESMRGGKTANFCLTSSSCWLRTISKPLIRSCISSGESCLSCFCFFVTSFSLFVIFVVIPLFIFSIFLFFIFIFIFLFFSIFLFFLFFSFFSFFYFCLFVWNMEGSRWRYS